MISKAIKRLVSLASVLYIFTYSFVYGGSWTIPTDLQTSGNTVYMTTTTSDDDGNITALWSDSDSILSATKPFGAPWDPTETLASTTNYSETVALATNDAGVSIGIWRSDTTSELYYSTRTFGGSWSAEATVTGAFTTDEEFAVTIDAAGNATLIYRRNSPDDVYAQSLPFGGAWTSPVLLSPSASAAYQVDIALDGSGNVRALFGPDASLNLYVAELPFGGSWSAATILYTATSSINSPKIAGNPDGDFAAAWIDGSFTGEAMAATLDFGGSWTPATQISLSSNCSSTRVDIDGGGNAVAVWLDGDSGIDILFTADHPFGGSWQTPFGISNPDYNAEDPTLSVNLDGYAAVGFNQRDEFGTDIVPQAARRPIGGSWSAPVQIQTTVDTGSFENAIVVDPFNNSAFVMGVYDEDHVFASNTVANPWVPPVIQTWQPTLREPILVGDALGNASNIYFEEFPSENFISYREKPVNGLWTNAAAVVSTGTNEIFVIDAAMNPSGYTLLCWVVDDTINTLYAATQQFGGTWSAPTALLTSPLAIRINCVMDPAGNGTIVYRDSDTGITGSFALPFGGSWSGSTTITTDPLGFQSDLVVDGSGNITFLIDKDNAVQAYTLPFGGSWSSPVVVSPTYDIVIRLDAAANSSGTVEVIWNADSGADTIAAAATHPFGGSWSAVTQFTTNSVAPSLVGIAIDSSGNAVAVWEEDSSPTAIFAASKPTGGSWDPAVQLSNGALNASDVSISMNGTGTTFVMWKERTTTTLVNTPYESHMNFGGSWSTPFEIEYLSMGGESASYLDPFNTVTVVWGPGDGPSTRYASSSNLGPIVFGLTPVIGPTIGGTEVTITGGGFTGATEVFFGTDPATSFIVIDDNTIIAFSPPHPVGPVFVTVVTPFGTSPEVTVGIFTYIEAVAPEPPAAFTGKAGGDRFLTQTDIFNFLRWEASPSLGVVSYRLYRDGDLLATISADSPLQYIDHNRKKRVTYVYTLTAVNIFDQESTALVVALRKK